MMFRKNIWLIMFFVSLGSTANLSDVDRDDLAKTWANTKMVSMSEDEKIGQLFMIQAYSNLGTKHEEQLMDAVRKYHIGGLAFFQGTPKKQLEITKKLQENSQIPLLVAIDAEWGLGMRLDSAMSFPRQFTLGAIQDNRLIYEMGKEIGMQLKALGVHMNFAPVVDINSNPENPVIGDRSFGDNKKNVTRKSYAYMKGMQDVGILACAKHFPGHGDTNKDSHKTLPNIDKSIADLEENELFPFSLLFKQGVKSVMVGHLQVPAMDDRKNRPASLSAKIIQGWIREKMQYEGLVMTDALGMKGVSDHYRSGEIEVEAFRAGNDILTVSQSLPGAYKAMQKAVKKKKISRERLNESVLRILVTKFEAGLFFPPEINRKSIDTFVNNPKALALKEDLYRNAITYLEGKDGALPILSPVSEHMATLAIGASEKTPFQKRVESYCNPKHYNIHPNEGAAQFRSMFEALKGFETILVSFEALNNRRSRGYGISAQSLSLIRKLQNVSKVYVVLLGNPYSLSQFNSYDNILMAYENDPVAADMAAQAIFGSSDIKGKLPVSPGKGFKYGQGKELLNARILGYALPEKVGLSTEKMMAIDRLVDTIISSGAAPGCQVLVAKDGYIVYDKSFGYHTYKKERPVKNSDVYDLASVTKIMATTLASMKLYEEGKMDIFKPFSEYLDGAIDSSNKRSITIIEALAHHAGLKPWIPFYNKTLDTLDQNKIIPSNEFYREHESADFSYKVADKLYIRNDYADSIRQMIIASELRRNKDYRYSDLGLYLVRDVIEKVSGHRLDSFLQNRFYEPMNLVHTGFNPLTRQLDDEIVPTEIDDYFRMQELKGNVHDMGAAMLGGISGHAGLFSNTKDLAVLMQMLLNKGVYGNRRYLDHNTIYTFTTRYHRSSRRGIGFDMKELNNKKNSNMSELAPSSTFGHYGFTGTCVFGDPDNNIVYVFLSNRTYPSMENNKLGKEDYRSRIQTIIYESLIP